MSDGPGGGRRAIQQEVSSGRPHESLFWRKLAHWGASQGPEWLVRYSPPVVGAAVAVLVPSARKAVQENLVRIRGEVSPVRDAKEVLATFASFASCLAEVLSNDSENGARAPQATVYGERNIHASLVAKKGAVLVTAHTGGWESVGALLGREYGLPMMFVMHPEGDEEAREMTDKARMRAGVQITHVREDDPLASLPLLRHLREGGIVGIQLDRTFPGMRTHEVELLGERTLMPAGPLRLAQISGAPLLPVFCARVGYRKYVVEAYEALPVSRHATDEERAALAQRLADCLTDFLRRHPTQWFKWSP